MRRVWFTWSAEFAERLDEELGLRPSTVLPELPPEEWAEALWSDLDVWTGRLEWEGVPFLFLASDHPLARQVLAPELVLEVTPALRDALDLLAVLSDTLPPLETTLKLARFGEVLRCRKCRTIVTTPMSRTDPHRVLARRHEQLRPYQYGVIEEPGHHHPIGHFVTSLDGLINTVLDDDLTDYYEGGFHAKDGPNQRCTTCRALVAEYWSSDWFGSFVVFPPAAVELIPA